MSTNQKYALITGATSGIGYELAKLFAKDHYNLVIVARSPEDLEKTSLELSKEYGVEVIPISKDLSLHDSPFDVYNDVAMKGIQIDVLVNNAGQGQYGEFVETDINRDLEIIQLNIGAYVVLTKLFLSEMIAKGEGKILNVSSIGSKLPGPLIATYHATKAFVQSFSESIRAELKDKGITVTTLLPGITDTDFFNKAEMNDAKILHTQSKADAAEVALDGYKALMNGEDKVISGVKNKIQVGISNLIPDGVLADGMLKQNEPVENDKK